MAQTTDKATSEISNTFPRSLLTVSREEFGLKEDNPDATQPPLKLLVKDGKTLPLDLQGHVFVIAPAGSVDSSCTSGTKIVSPASDGATPMYNGDGIVYRLDFNNLAEGITLTSRLMKTPCYYADVATNRCKEYQKPKNYRFESFGIVRFSKNLGLRNQVNTAFLPMQFSDAEGYRLLAAWDMGRPYEIDPQTLEAVTPIGKNTAWRPMNPLMADLPFQPPFPFPLVQSTAHPCFDFNTKQMFTVNAGRSILAFIAQLRPVIDKAVDIVETIKNPVKRNLLFKNPASENEIEEDQAPKTSFSDKLWFVIKKIIHFLYSLIQAFNIFNNFVYIVRWDGVNEPEKWQVMVSNLKPLKIKQSMHQIGLTKDYVILIDTAFKTLIEELFPATTKQGYRDLEKWLRTLWDRPQLPETYLYLVRRDELQAGKKRVKASKLVIPRETTHFVMDYENPNQQITLHLAHMSAWDVAEWIRDIDEPVFATNNGKAGKLAKLFGLILSPLDINLMASYVIDAKNHKKPILIRSDFTGAYKEFTSNKTADKGGNDYSQYSWGHSLFTCLDNQPKGRLEDIYWSSVGCWQELLTKYSVELYKDYKYRQVPVEEVLKITQDGVQANLLRLHVHPLENLPPNQNRLEIQDGYQFENNWFGTSPQFIPRAGGTGNSTDGYIVCMVHYGDGNEPDNGNQIWIFDAANLKDGPICQLWHPQLKMGFTVHTTWLPKIAKRTASYNVDIEEDYHDLVAKQPEEIKELFRKWVYKKKEPPIDCKC